MGRARHRWLVPRPSPPALSLLPCLHFQNGLRTPLQHSLLFPLQLPDAKNLLCRRRQRRRHLSNPCATSSCPSLAISQPRRRPTCCPRPTRRHFSHRFKHVYCTTSMGGSQQFARAQPNSSLSPALLCSNPHLQRSRTSKGAHRNSDTGTPATLLSLALSTTACQQCDIRPIRWSTRSPAKSKSTVTVAICRYMFSL